MDMYNIKWTRLQAEIFRFFCIKAGQTLNLRGIASHLKKSPTAVSKAILDLEKEGFLNVKKEKKMNLVLIEFNRNNENAINLKRVENLKLIYESGFAKFLEENFPGSAIILFGSYSRGDDIFIEDNKGHKSDIDIAVIGIKNKKIIEAKEKEIESAKFDKLLEREIILNFYPSLKEIHKNLRENILNGILISGSIEL